MEPEAGDKSTEANDTDRSSARQTSSLVEDELNSEDPKNNDEEGMEGIEPDNEKNKSPKAATESISDGEVKISLDHSSRSVSDDTSSGNDENANTKTMVTPEGQSDHKSGETDDENATVDETAGVNNEISNDDVKLNASNEFTDSEEFRKNNSKSDKEQDVNETERSVECLHDLPPDQSSDFEASIEQSDFDDTNRGDDENAKTMVAPEGRSEIGEANTIVDETADVNNEISNGDIKLNASNEFTEEFRKNNSKSDKEQDVSETEKSVECLHDLEESRNLPPDQSSDFEASIERLAESSESEKEKAAPIVLQNLNISTREVQDNENDQNRDKPLSEHESGISETPRIDKTKVMELEKSVDSILQDASTYNKDTHVESDSFEESIENLAVSDKIDDSRELTDRSTERSVETTATEDASDMEKYMENKFTENVDLKKLPQVSILDEHERIQRRGGDKDKEQLSASVTFKLDPTQIRRGYQASSGEESDTDSVHSIEESDHFKGRTKPNAVLDALRSDTSSSDRSHSKSGNQHHCTAYGSIEIHEDRSRTQCCCCVSCYPNGFKREFKDLLPVMLNMFFIGFFQFLIEPIALMYNGHISGNDDAFLGVALALCVINIAGISVAIGVGEGFDTLFSQANKCDQKEEMVIVLQRGIVFALMSVTPCLAVLLNAESILLAIGFNPLICSITDEYLLIFIPGLLAYFFHVILTKFIQNQNKLLFVLWIGLLSCLINVMLHFILVWELGLGSRGSAISLSCTCVFMLLITMAYFCWAGCVKKIWDLSWRRKSVQEWGSVFTLVFPSLIAICVQWWIIEVGIILAVVYGITDFGAQAILVHLELICYTFPLGIAMAATRRISDRLLVGCAEAAKTVARVALTITVIVAALLVLLLVLLSTHLPKVFTANRKITDLAGDLIPFMCLYIFFDSVLIVCWGIFRACGREVFGAILIVIVCFISAGIGLILTFYTTSELQGWWIVLGIMCALASLVCFIIALSTNWEKQVKQAKKRYSVSMSKSSNSGGKQGEKDALLAAKEKDFTASYDDYYSKDFDFHASYECPTRTYSGPNQYDASKTNETTGRQTLKDFLETWQLVLRRGSLFLLFTGILAAGIVLRLFTG